MISDVISDLISDLISDGISDVISDVISDGIYIKVSAEMVRNKFRGRSPAMLLSFILGMLPIIWLIIALLLLKMPGFKACAIAAVIALATAILEKGMTPSAGLTAAAEGALNALWPILIVIIAALFTYNVTLKTGAMETIKTMLAGVSEDKRILALIICFAFGFFMEGMAGFGTAVAIPASILVAMGFEPIPTVVALLVVNSTPTAFGSVGVPTTTLASLTGISELTLSANTAVLSALLMFLSPFIMICIIGGGVRALKGVMGITLVSALVMTVPELIIAKLLGPQLPDIISSILCLVVTVVLALKRRNKPVPEEYRTVQTEPHGITVKEGIRAWAPFILIAVVLLMTSKLVPFINEPLSSVKSSFHIYSGDPDSSLSFTWINTPGVLIFFCGLVGGLIQGASLKKILGIFGETVKNNIKTIITICSVLATARIMQYSGMTMDIANALVAVTGTYFPLFSPLVGTLGAFVTGSGTSTCVLFGPMQAATAEAIGSEPAWLAVGNSLGAGIGKMISPSNVAIGAAASGLAGQENKLIQSSLKYTILFVIIGGLCCYFLPYPGVVAS